MNTKNNLSCLGTGLVTLDAIFDFPHTKPSFFAGGSCANVLAILSYFGWKSYPLARLGKDVEGNRVIEDLKKCKVNTKFIKQETNTKTPRIIERIYPNRNPKHRFNLKCEHKKWLPRRKPYLLNDLENIWNKLPKCSVFYFDRASASALFLARNLKKQGCLIVFEPPKFLDDTTFIECLKVADIVKHCFRQTPEITKTRVKIPIEIQTKGEEGLYFKAPKLGQKTWRHMDSIPVLDVIDEAGSGDWLSAGLIYFLNNKKSKLTKTKLEQALRFGQYLASLNCSYVGARGLMYNTSQKKLFDIIEPIFKKEDSLDKITKLPKSNRKLQSRFAAKCKICSC